MGRGKKQLIPVLFSQLFLPQGTPLPYNCEARETTYTDRGCGIFGNTGDSGGGGHLGYDFRGCEVKPLLVVSRASVSFLWR